MTKSPPRNVIRFYGDPKYALETIGFKEITFLHANMLNDPLDPPFYFITDFNEDYQTLCKYIQQYHTDYLKRFKSHLTKKNWNKYITGVKKYFNECINNAFIFSTCAMNNQEHPKDSLYMWGHYGNGHRGVAIEFDTNLLTSSVLKTVETKETEQLSKIYYRSELPKITCESIYKAVIEMTENNQQTSDKTELFNIIQLALSTKSKVWEKENEWRFILRNSKSKMKILRVALEDDTITALYLGCRTDDNMKKDLIYETKQIFSNAKVYKSKISKNNFSLEFDQLS